MFDILCFFSDVRIFSIGVEVKVSLAGLFLFLMFFLRGRVYWVAEGFILFEFVFCICYLFVLRF